MPPPLAATALACNPWTPPAEAIDDRCNYSSFPRLATDNCTRPSVCTRLHCLCTSSNTHPFLPGRVSALATQILPKPAVSLQIVKTESEVTACPVHDKINVRAYPLISRRSRHKKTPRLLPARRRVSLLSASVNYLCQLPGLSLSYAIPTIQVKYGKTITYVSQLVKICKNQISGETEESTNW